MDKKYENRTKWNDEKKMKIGKLQIGQKLKKKKTKIANWIKLKIGQK